jgi:hypothetical protein
MHNTDETRNKCDVISNAQHGRRVKCELATNKAQHGRSDKQGTTRVKCEVTSNAQHGCCVK